MVSIPSTEESELCLLLDSLRLRLGATGKDRVMAVDSLFRQISEIIVPGYIKFSICLTSVNDNFQAGKDLDYEKFDIC